MDVRRRDRIAIWALAALCLLLGALLAISVVSSTGAPPRRGAEGPRAYSPSDPSTPTPSPTATPEPTSTPENGHGGGSGSGSGGGTGVGGGNGSGGGSINQPSPSYSISGTLAQQLRPGDTYPLDLTLTNLGGVAMTVIDLRVTISQVTAPNATASHPCGLNDFAATQVASSFSLDLGPAESTSLSARSVPSSQWPQISMINSAANQDGCKGATLALSFTGSSTVTP